MTNGAGFRHSHLHGFGLLNAWRLVNAAKVYPPPNPSSKMLRLTTFLGEVTR